MCEKYFSFAEYQEILFPDLILNYLGRQLREYFNLKQKHQLHIDKDEQDPRIGFVGIAKAPQGSREKVVEVVQDFYQTRKFAVLAEPKSPAFEVRKNEDAYSVWVLEGDTSYVISIYRSPFEEVGEVLVTSLSFSRSGA